MYLMILSFAFLVSAFQVHLAFAQPPTTQSAIDELSLVTRYAGMGYNALQANPEGDFYSGGIDPGIKTIRLICKHPYSGGKHTVLQSKSANF